MPGGVCLPGEDFVGAAFGNDFIATVWCIRHGVAAETDEGDRQPG